MYMYMYVYTCTIYMYMYMYVPDVVYTHMYGNVLVHTFL